MKKYFVCLILAFVLLFFGCIEIIPGGFKLPSACDEIQGPSKFCEMAAEHGVNLTLIADSFGVLNDIAIHKNKYTKAQALEVLTRLRLFMNSPVSYAAFRLELTEILDRYSYLKSTSDRYISMLVSTQVIYPEDLRLIKGWLDRLIAGLAP